jgi:hypothetical protein
LLEEGNMASTTPSSKVDTAVRASLGEALDSEHERLLVAGALVIRRGEHYSIAEGAEDWTRLDRLAAGVCDCGASLSVRDSRRHCRTCDREFIC